MARRLIGARAGQALASAGCCLVLVTGCTQTATPVPAPVDRGSASVQPSESASQTPSSADSAGSGGAGGGGGGGATDGGGGSGGSGATDGSGGNQAAGSPIDVPTIPEKHQPMDGLRDGIKALFIAACGGHELCVKLEFGDGACFVGYEPAALAARGSTVKVLTESQEDCDRANGVTGPGSATDGTTPGSAPTTDLPSSGTTGSGTDSSTPGNGQPDGSPG